MVLIDRQMDEQNGHPYNGVSTFQSSNKRNSSKRGESGKQPSN